MKGKAWFTFPFAVLVMCAGCATTGFLQEPDDGAVVTFEYKDFARSMRGSKPYIESIDGQRVSRAPFRNQIQLLPGDYTARIAYQPGGFAAPFVGEVSFTIPDAGSYRVVTNLPKIIWTHAAYLVSGA